MKAECNLKYPEARAQVMYDNPDLVSKIPSLQTKTKAKTYSSAAGSPNATTKIQNQQQIIFEQQKKTNRTDAETNSTVDRHCKRTLF